MQKNNIDKGIFYPSISVVVILTVLLVVFRDSAQPILDTAMSAINHRMDWAFQFLTIILFIILMWLAFGRHGNIKFGEGKPEFSTFSWGAMLFTAGMGTSIMFWSMMEPISYYIGPPFGIEPFSDEAAGWAVTYGLFHWGISAWAIYAFPTVAIAYAYYIRKNPSLKLSVSLAGALGKYANGWVAKIIDILVIWCLIGGLGTSLGLGVPMVSAVIGDVLNIGESIQLTIIIMISITIIYSASAYLGLQKGIRRLADFNVYLALAIAAFIFLVGPTLFILSYFTDSFGLMLQNFLYMSFHTDPIQQGGFPQAWTVFYWAWFSTTAPFMGLFISRISKGRTMRGLILHVLSWGTIGGWIYFAVFGGYTINLEINNILPISSIYSESGGPAAIVEILKSLPVSYIVLPFFIFLGIIFLSTSLDSATYILAAIATKELKEGQDPAKWHRMIWGAIMAALAVALLLVGGLTVVQSSAVIVSVPIFIIYILMIISLLRWLKQDYPIANYRK